MELRTIIARIMWRIAPALWLGWAIRNLLAWAIAILNDREERFWLEHDRSYAHWFGGWLAVIAARIDELIDLRAHMRLGRRWAPRVVPSHSPTPGVRSLEDCILRLSRLIERFEDVHRLAQCRAEALLRLSEVTTIDLIPDHRPAPGEDDFVPGDHVFAANPIVVGGVGAVVVGARIRAPPWLGLL